MNIEDIKKLPIQGISDEISILWLWVTFPRLEQGLEVIRAWGFQYYGLGFEWTKKNRKSDTPFWGMGYYTRQNTEVCLIGVKKDRQCRIKPLVKNEHSALYLPVENHSKKPEVVRNKIVNICGDLPRIELFARQNASGWDCWGNDKNITSFSIHEISKPKFDPSQIRIDSDNPKINFGLPDISQKLAVGKDGKVEFFRG